MEGAYPSFFEVSSTNHVRWVVIVTVTFLVYSIMGVVAKLVSRFRLAALKSYGWSVILGMVLAFVQSVLILKACCNGLGKHEAILSQQPLNCTRMDVILSLVVDTPLNHRRTYMPPGSRRCLRISCHRYLSLYSSWRLTREGISESRAISF